MFCEVQTVCASYFQVFLLSSCVLQRTFPQLLSIYHVYIYIHNIYIYVYIYMNMYVYPFAFVISP